LRQLCGKKAEINPIIVDKHIQCIYNVSIMTNISTLNIRIDSNIKKEAKEVFGELGLTISAAVNAYLRNVIRTKKVSFSLLNEPSDYFTKSLKEAKENRKKGLVSPAFENAEDALSWLKDHKAKYANSI